MTPKPLQTKVEEIRQACGIHGGVLNLLIAALGVRMSRVTIPSKRLRLLVFRQVYGKKYKSINEAEFEEPLANYPSINALFTRGVRPEFRPISLASDQFLCPCDGKVQDVGKIERGKLMTVKGIGYTISSLLPDIDTQVFEGGHFGIFFLSPNDCHRIFSPQDCRVEEVIHVPGYRLLVHPPFQRKEYPVFTLNERVILRLATPLGACILILVAGWGVGNITLRFDPQFKRRHRRTTRTVYSTRPEIRKGEWLATFELGSTAILITEPAEKVTVAVSRDAEVKYGQPAFSFGS
jgi:phosphatidylserine decarboxylase